MSVSRDYSFIRLQRTGAGALLVASWLLGSAQCLVVPTASRFVGVGRPRIVASRSSLAPSRTSARHGGKEGPVSLSAYQPVVNASSCFRWCPHSVTRHAAYWSCCPCCCCCCCVGHSVIVQRVTAGSCTINSVEASKHDKRARTDPRNMTDVADTLVLLLYCCTAAVHSSACMIVGIDAT